MGAGGVAQGIECLLFNLEAMSSNPSALKKTQKTKNSVLESGPGDLIGTLETMRY
jgi:hypothetical protein